VHAFLFLCVYPCIRECICAGVYMCLYVRLYVHVCDCAQTWIWVYVCKRVCTCDAFMDASRYAYIAPCLYRMICIYVSTVFVCVCDARHVASAASLSQTETHQGWCPNHRRRCRTRPPGVAATPWYIITNKMSTF